VDGRCRPSRLLGFATGTSPIGQCKRRRPLSHQLEDFHPKTTHPAKPNPGLTVRRAFRYVDSKAIAAIKASPSRPDVRVETQDTLYSEKTAPFSPWTRVTISRAGIFRLSFLLPDASTWNHQRSRAQSLDQLKTGAGRVITMHLNGKTEGARRFSSAWLALALKATNAWPVPQLIVARSQQATRHSVDCSRTRHAVAGRKARGPDSTRSAESRHPAERRPLFPRAPDPWNLAVDIEQVDPWIQVTSLQHALITKPR